jgi:hypothetical protein
MKMPFFRSPHIYTYMVMISGDSQKQGQNVMVEWLILLLHIREVPGSTLGPETSYPG